MCDWEARYQAYLEELRREFPALRFVEKAGDPLSRTIDLALKVVTLGRQRHYLDRYTTVIGWTVYLPTDWARRSPERRYVTMRHEAVHLRQCRRYGFLRMAFLYLVPFFPIGLAWGRARLEWEAYAETLRAIAEVHGLAAARAPEVREQLVLQFTSGAYGWMWPFRRQVERWIDEVLATLPS
jgi:hypothetical protein